MSKNRTDGIENQKATVPFEGTMTTIVSSGVVSCYACMIVDHVVGHSHLSPVSTPDGISKNRPGEMGTWRKASPTLHNQIPDNVESKLSGQVITPLIHARIDEGNRRI